MGSDSIIFHIDMDGFFSSVEVREDPSLKGLPVVVGSDPKGGEGRGVVSTCSYEAREYGIHSAMPISKAYRLCPDAVFLPVNMQLYHQVSENIMELLKSYASGFQQVSVDEAYLDVTGIVSNYEEAAKLARKIKDHIRTSEGITCSIGIAPNKTVAKIASDYEKPDGLTVVTPDSVREFLYPLDVSKIPGVGAKSQIILEKMGIRTIGDIGRTDVQLLIAKFGKSGIRFKKIANGTYSSEIVEHRLIKSISKEDTFEEDVADTNVVKKTLAILSEQVHTRLLRKGFVFRTVNLKVRFSDFSTYTRSVTLSAYSNDKMSIYRTALRMFSEFEGMGSFRLVGVGVSKLVKMDEKQRRLDDFFDVD
ncbi:DNA polymerase IV (DinB-like DNA polymerase) [Methanohalophilus levihalophilus]|uniref:DNA polymerase IV n=1 Tax=Methanohalophilus levihalophilus TaxID=1431282 RepID=UPI001AE7F482|nr:DNA polymerase IV [Methanohalophilus levihalophilus]MBP2029290.1 DNA polymerase IV (DinB-like DNA polymerase) [Methanohalophilus levihalophilus]